jgi:hypothetical protein
VHILDGGGITVSGNAKLTATGGVFLYNAAHSGNCGAVTVSGNASVNVTAATTGQFAGVAVAQERSCAAAWTVSGNATASISGSLYAPDAPVTVSGNAILTETQSDFVANEMTVSGNAKLTLN